MTSDNAGDISGRIAGVGGSERGGVIENISKGGCRCVLETVSADKIFSSDVLNNTVTLRCRFPGSEGETGVTGEIRNSTRESDEIAVGIQFLHLDRMDEVREDIHNYIRLIEWSSEAV